MSSTISQISQSVSVGGVGRVTLTPIEQDAATGEYVREVRVFEPADQGGNGRLVYSLQVRSASRAGVLIATPEQVTV